MNPNRIVSPARTAVVGHDQHGWTASEREIKQLMGLPKKLTKQAVPPQVIQGVKVWVESTEEAKALHMFHRVRCKCPECGWVGSVGRLAQHVCYHKHKES